MLGSDAAPHDNGVKKMVIDNKNWLNDLYCWLDRAYRNKENFKEFCVFMSDFKKVGITYDELCAALRCSKKVAEDIIELSILAKDNKYYKYRISENTYDNLCEKSLRFLSHIDIMTFRDFWKEMIARNTRNLMFLYQSNIKQFHVGLWNTNRNIQEITFPFLRISKRIKISESFAG